MEQASNLTVVIDAGHGGHDPGAVYGGRLEKDDNLALSKAVRDILKAQGVNVIMTRDSDVFIPLPDRARIANEADADLFVSIHRNSTATPDAPQAHGVENFIYLTAPEQTSGRAAQSVLSRVADVGVQVNRGVKRGNYYVLRRTQMPSMLLEMGFITNAIDNRLLDENLNNYATAIAQGILDYFEIDYNPSAQSAPAPSQVRPTQMAMQAQRILNDLYGTNLSVNGVFDNATKRVIVSILQSELNLYYNAGLNTDGVYGPATRAALRDISIRSPGNLPLIVQLLLLINNYNPGRTDDIYGPQTSAAVQNYQRDHGIMPSGIATRETIDSMLTI